MTAGTWILPDPDDVTATARHERLKALAEWTLTPSQMRVDLGMPSSQKDLAALFGVTSGAVSQWKHTPEYNRIMSSAMRTHYGAERLARVIENMHQIAIGDSPQAVPAARTLIQFVQTAETKVDPLDGLEELSDHEVLVLKEAALRLRAESASSKSATMRTDSATT